MKKKKKIASRAGGSKEKKRRRREGEGQERDGYKIKVGQKSSREYIILSHISKSLLYIFILKSRTYPWLYVLSDSHYLHMMDRI